jgi:cell division protease FtsH
MAATNRADTLDAALLRPGRFDRTVEIPLPNQRERRAILAIHGRSKILADDVALDTVSRGTPGFSGADLANLVNEAAINAVRGGHDVLTGADFDMARDRLLLGHRDSSGALLPIEKDAVAVHEAGHALVAMLSEHADPVAKVTILPRGAVLGVTEQLPEFERHLYPQSYLTDSLTVRLGGRAAEIVVLGEPSTGAADDLASATDLATRMVRDWGLSADVGPVGYGAADLSGEHPLAGRRYAEQTQRTIDAEVAHLLRRAETTATGLLRDHRDALDRVIGLLLERETVDGTDLADVAGLPQRHPGNGRLWPRTASSGSSRP